MAKVVPTVQMILGKYAKIAAVERLRQGGRPGEKTVRNAIVNVRRVCELGSIPLDEPIATLTRRRLTMILDAARLAGLKPITVWSYLQSLKAVVAHWTRPYYADLKWHIPDIELPSCVRNAPRYVRPDKAVLEKVKAWYASLETRQDAREWVAATLMLEFAMRNGDVERLRWADFRERDGAVSLCYIPHKTSLSSGRRVAWPVHPDIWEKFCAYRRSIQKSRPKYAQLVVPCAADVFSRLNRDLRLQQIFTGVKGCYELRKICIDHIYQKFGAEMASSISGDDIRTMIRYYADPSQPNIGEVRIIDLL